MDITRLKNNLFPYLKIAWIELQKIGSRSYNFQICIFAIFEFADENI